jgi:hypothetical protein
MVQNGSTGPAVSRLQDRLRELGSDPGATDGDFGPLTEAAVRDFQAKHNLEVDGVVGPQTWGALGIVVETPHLDNVAGDFGGNVVNQARAMMNAGYHFPPNNTNQFYHRRFEVGVCANFAIDSWAKAGKDLQGEVPNPNGATSIMNYMKEHNAYVPRDGAAAPGDMIFFQWPGDSWEASHVAIVSEVDGSGRPTRIIESYDNNLPVREREVGDSAGSIVGFAHAG